MYRPRSSGRLWHAVGRVRVLARLGLRLGWGIVSVGICIVVLLQEIWAASVAVFFQDLSAPGPVPNCGMAWQAVCLAGNRVRNRDLVCLFLALLE